MAINLRPSQGLGSILNGINGIITGGLGRHQVVLILHSSKDDNLVLARIPEHSAVTTTVMSRREKVGRGVTREKSTSSKL
jgi:hypothetical protein